MYTEHTVNLGPTMEDLPRYITCLESHASYYISHDKYNIIDAINDCIVPSHRYNDSIYTALCAFDVISLRDRRTGMHWLWKY